MQGQLLALTHTKATCRNKNISVIGTHIRFLRFAKTSNDGLFALIELGFSIKIKGTSPLSPNLLLSPTLDRPQCGCFVF